MTHYQQRSYSLGTKKADARFTRVLVVLGVWTLVCGASSFAMLLPSWRPWTIKAISIFAFTTMFGIYWTMTGKRTHKFAKSKLDVVMNCVTGIFLSGTFSLVSVIGVGVMPLIVRYYSVQEYQRELAEYQVSPSGFNYMKKLAKDHFGVQLVLADSAVGWMDTQMESPVRSPASVHVGPGFCELRIFPSGITSQAGGTEAELAAWSEGVEIHEIGHCIDIQRDFDSNRELVSEPKSMPPLLSGTAPTLAYWGSPASKQWREIFSDLLALGYWKIKHASVFPKLSTQLIAKRTESVKGPHPDFVHDTSCWVEWATRQNMPGSFDALTGWADEMRQKAPCKITASSKPLPI